MTHGAIEDVLGEEVASNFASNSSLLIGREAALRLRIPRVRDDWLESRRLF